MYPNFCQTFGSTFRTYIEMAYLIIIRIHTYTHAYMHACVPMYIGNTTSLLTDSFLFFALRTTLENSKSE